MRIASIEELHDAAIDGIRVENYAYDELEKKCQPDREAFNIEFNQLAAEADPTEEVCTHLQGPWQTANNHSNHH